MLDDLTLVRKLPHGTKRLALCDDLVAKRQDRRLGDGGEVDYCDSVTIAGYRNQYTVFSVRDERVIIFGQEGRK